MIVPCLSLSRLWLCLFSSCSVDVIAIARSFVATFVTSKMAVGIFAWRWRNDCEPTNNVAMLSYSEVIICKLEEPSYGCQERTGLDWENGSTMPGPTFNITTSRKNAELWQGFL